MPEFKAFASIPRLNREIVITEKIDGTNGCIVIGEDGSVGAQSRNRIITESGDSFGFAIWVQKNSDMLKEILSVGYHFGEWWGAGIQRGYSIPSDGASGRPKCFSLFNTARWSEVNTKEGLRCVPVMYKGPFAEVAINDCLTELYTYGSMAAKGFMNPEGIVIYHTAANSMFKITLENDAEGKGKKNANPSR